MADNSFTPTRQDDQNFKFDAIESFNENILGVDNEGKVINPRSIERIRSTINIDSNINQLSDNNLKKIYLGQLSTGNLSPESTPQESRCHAFYRIIGFPVISKNNGIFNPGHDIIYNSDEERKITPEKKATIATDLLPGFQELSRMRETYITLLLKIFSVPESVVAGTLALSSLNIRDFIAPLKDSNVIEKKFNIENQAYTVEDETIVGNNYVKFKDYIDVSGKKLSDYSNTNFLKKRYHIIKPFAVDPRIDVSVPAEKRVAVPFTLEASQRIVTTFGVDNKTPNKVQVDPPLIEAIILEKFIVENQASKTGELPKDTIESIKNIEEINDEQIIKDIISGQVYGTVQQQYFVYYLNIIRAMVNQLAASLKVIEEIQSEYYWIPIPNKFGPEKGSEISALITSIFDSTKNLQVLQTEKDKELCINYLRAIFDKIAASVSDLSESPSVADVAGYASKSIPLFFNKTAKIGNTNADQLTKLEKKRSKVLKIANQQLQIIEMIMGEFSGFGLCDMIAIMGGLYLMPAESLLGFLDDDAYIRAIKHPSLKGKIPQTNPSTIDNALNDLTENVKSLYNIMDKLIQEALG